MQKTTHLFKFYSEPFTLRDLIDRISEIIYKSGGQIFIVDADLDSGTCRIGLYSTEKDFKDIVCCLSSLKACKIYL